MRPKSDGNDQVAILRTVVAGVTVVAVVAGDTPCRRGEMTSRLEAYLPPQGRVPAVGRRGG